MYCICHSLLELAKKKYKNQDEENSSTCICYRVLYINTLSPPSFVYVPHGLYGFHPPFDIPQYQDDVEVTIFSYGEGVKIVELFLSMTSAWRI